MILINDNENSDVFLPEDVFEEIAESVLTNLKDHPFIGLKLESFQQEHPNSYINIVQDVADTIHEGITEYVDVNYFKGDETANMKILSVNEAREELRELFKRNMDASASS